MTHKKLANQRLSAASLRTLMAEIAELEDGSTLHVTDGSSERIFYFVRGGARMLSCGPKRGLGFEQCVSRLADVDREAVSRAIEESHRHGRELRCVLADEGILSREGLSEAIVHLIREALCDLVFWTNAFFTLHTRPPPDEIYDPDRGGIGGTVENAKLAEEVVEWLDNWSRWRHVLHSDQTQVHATSPAREDGTALAPPLRALLEACAAERSIRDLWLDSGRSLSEVCRDIVELVGKQLVVVTPDRSWVRRSPEEEIAELEESLGHLVAKDLVRERLVLLYRRTRQPGKAVEQLKILARNALAARDLAKANERYKLILNLQPEDVEVFETLIDLNSSSKFVKHVKNFALNHLQRLAHRLLDQEADRCARILEGLPGVGTEVIEFKASLLASRGKTREAAVECMRVAKLYDDRGEIALASHLYRKAAAYQNRPSTPEAAAKSVSGAPPGDGSSAASRPARRRRSNERPVADAPSRRSGLLAAALLLVAGGAYFYWRDELGIAARADAFSGTLAAAGGTARGERPGDPGISPAPRSIAETRGEASRPPGDRERTPAGSGDPCSDPRSFRTRRLSAARVAVYSDFCRLTIQNEDGQVVRVLEGEAGGRWAIGYGGEQICRWQPGQRPVVFTTASEAGLSLDWSIPGSTDSLAVAADRIIIRDDTLTVVYSFEGVHLREAEVPAWDEGVIVGDLLVLTRSRSSPRALWFVAPESLHVLWSCRNEPEGLVVW